MRERRTVAGIRGSCADIDNLEARLEVEESEIARIALGQMVELRFAALNESVFSTVSEIDDAPLPPESGVTKTAKRVRKYAVTVPLREPDGRLRLDMAVRGRIFY